MAVYARPLKEPAMDRAERIEYLCVSYAIICAELTEATDDRDIRWLRTELLAIEADLAELTVEPDCVRAANG
jgi:hypothetical protein